MILKESIISNWGHALLSIAKKENKIETYSQQASVIIEILKEKQGLNQILSTPNIDFDKKMKIIDEIFVKFDFEPYIVNAIRILVRQKSFIYCRAIFKKLRKNLHEEQHILFGTIWSTIELNPEQIKKIEKKISLKLQQNVVLINKLDPKLIGGIQVIVKGNTFDGSIRGKLQAIKTSSLSNRE
ncbi:F0F1 ATP synthase subunit delta [Spiroplasma sabaudiense Ar-1343]|uniref:ATP synthase subunit delta n=1 Tax=Spiroplasma sabaudiense Ar-1343 TaxID=1276257 RepID=W6A8H1_9MOLU|nr:F0F1 ATP synthase subunit delta [Spiroplasma sabaudiense]AHI53463.1 F0F1 ATP synthase subunit delta [Spiroplasma sabaudiense Ar-1343]